MTALALRVGGLIITSPFTAVTNLGIAISCVWWALRLRNGDSRTALWRWFFLIVGVAMALGAPKHGLALYKFHPLVAGLIAVSGMLAVVSASCAQMIVTRHLRCSEATARWVLWAAPLQVGGFFGGVAAGWSFLAVLVFVVPGLLLLCLVEWWMWSRERDGHLWSALGLTVGIVPAVTYVTGWPQWGWFTHVDLAHLLVWLALGLVAHGAHQQAARGSASSGY